MKPALAILAVLLSSASARAADPAVIELFASQGCSSCPPAELILNEFATRPDVLALDFAVTYWDQLGWKDTFAQPAFTQRQYDYAQLAARSGVWTPQFIVNGRILEGAGPEQLEAAISSHAVPGPKLEVTGAQVLVTAARTATSATVWLVQYDPRLLQVDVKAGENSGRTLPHRNVVKHLGALGDWSGTAKTYTLPPATPGLERAVLVQAQGVGPILAALKLPRAP